MLMPRPYVVDFESDEILARPHYPPVPVGVSIYDPSQRAKPKYYAWGHPTKNNCTKREAMRALHKVWNTERGVLFHHGKFDVDVAETHMECGPLPWHRIHDSMFLLFLNNPHARSLGLKESAEELLDMPPDERDEVREWLIAHKIVKAADKKWGRFIGKAPGDLVGRYANGDTLRTWRLFAKVWKSVVAEGMLEAYQTEQELMPIFLRSEREGIRADLRGMKRDLDLYLAANERVEKYIKKRLGLNQKAEFPKDTELADLLDAKDLVTEWVLTPTGKRSMSKDNLSIDMFSDKKFALALGYHSRLATCLGTFLIPWIRLAEANGGRLHTNWNQVRQTGERGFSGTRTGRPSSNGPNFLNVPKIFTDKNDGYMHPAFLKLLPELPLMRTYILPDDGRSHFVHRDFSQQEIRILAHFENAGLMEAYQADPFLDVHKFVQDFTLDSFGLDIPRRAIKILNFGVIYGMGLAKLAHSMMVDVQTAALMKKAQRGVISGLADLEQGIKDRAAEGLPIRTFGGRIYYEEPPRFDPNTGRYQTFVYKLLNYLIQGSAADHTKRAVINYDKMRVNGRFLVTVYDECNISAPKKHWKEESEILRVSMEKASDFDVRMLTDCKIGPNWGSIKAVK